MGTVWSYDSKVLLFLLLDAMVCLCNPNAADRIENSIALDDLYKH